MSRLAELAPGFWAEFCNVGLIAIKVTLLLGCWRCQKEAILEAALILKL